MGIEKDIYNVDNKVRAIENRMKIGTGSFKKEYNVYLMSVIDIEEKVNLEDVVVQILKHLNLKPVVPEPQDPVELVDASTETE